MKIGIGLPSIIPWATPEQVIACAVAAEEEGFSSVGVIDRLVYANTEPLVTLGAAAAVTTRIKLMTSILLAPLRVNAALLAKQAATVNHLSHGRLLLGMAVGGYEDDYKASGLLFSERGRRFDAMLAEMVKVWAGEARGVAGPIGPRSGVQQSQIVFGGQNAKTFVRVATYGGGWIAGSRGVKTFRAGADGVLKAWEQHRREGKPRLMALPYFALGATAKENAIKFLTDHYALEGPAALRMAENALTDVEAVNQTIAAYAAAGCDELMLFPCSPEPEQVRLLAGSIR